MEKRNVASLIKELRKASGLNQSHIADMLNVERSGISKIESGVPALSQEVIRKMASIFKINPDFIDGKTDNAFLPGSLLKLKIKHYIDIFGGSSMTLPLLIMLDTQRLSFVFLLNKFKVEYILAKDELGSVFVMEIIFNLKLDDAISSIINSAAAARKKMTMKALPLSQDFSRKLGSAALKKEDILYCFEGEKREASDLEKMLIDLVRHKAGIKDIVLFLKGMGLK